MLGGVATWSIRHTRLVLAVWAGAVVGVGSLALWFHNPFAPTDLHIPGTPSARWQALDNSARFGTNVDVLLRGPASEVERQGQLVVGQLRAQPELRVLSPFDIGAHDQILRPTPDAAVVVVDVVQRPGAPIYQAVAPVQRIIARSVHLPVRSFLGGGASWAKGLNDEAWTATHHAELIALPVLIAILLIVFRSPVAAALPGIVGLSSVIIGTGLVTGLARITKLDATAVTMASMMGLALGVDYSLLLVARFRENRLRGPRDATPETLVGMTGATAGHTVAFAGALLVAEMLAAVLLSPGAVLLSAAAGVIAVTTVGALTSLIVTPSLLAATAQYLDRWHLGRRPSEAALAGRAAGWILRRRLLVAPLAALGLLFLASPALGLKTGSLDVRLLPEGSPARHDASEFSKVLGPGFGALLEVVFRAPDGPITTGPLLQAMQDLQQRIAEDRDVQFVVGPGALATPARRITDLQRSTSDSITSLARARSSIEVLNTGLSGAERALADFQANMSLAHADVASARSSGPVAAKGSEMLTKVLALAANRLAAAFVGLKKAVTGGDQLGRALGTAHGGTLRLARALATLEARVQVAGEPYGALASRLAAGEQALAALRAPAQTADHEVGAALDELRHMTVGKLDARYAAALAAVARAVAAVSGKDPQTGGLVDSRYPGLDQALAGAYADAGQLSSTVAAARAETQALSVDLARLRSGAVSLLGGLDTAQSRGHALTIGLSRSSDDLARQSSLLTALHDGAARLAVGLAQLNGNGQRLAALVSDGTREVSTLSGGLQASGQVNQYTTMISSAAATARQAKQIQLASPGLGNSGYLPLAAVDGASVTRRQQAQFVVDLDSGGRYARFLIVPRVGANTKALSRLDGRLTNEVQRFAGRRGLEAGVGGLAALLVDYSAVTSHRIRLLIAVLAAVSFVVLAVILRSIVLPALCVVLNLLTVGVAFGVLSAGFDGNPPPLGGPGYIDVISLLAAFTVVFALSIDYQVFLLTRMREEFLKFGDHRRAVEVGLGSTASVVTGAAAIMIGVFLSFALSPFITLREIGVGLAAAVFLDATVVRLVLLPAAMLLFGARTWWLPRPICGARRVVAKEGVT